MKKLLLLTLILLTLNATADTKKALEHWQGLKYGMFIHYGLYSVAGGVWKDKQIPYYAEQIMNHARIPIDEYEQLADGFTAAGWNADSVVLLAKNSGMKYIVITSKHHDGFNMYESKVSPYNVVQRTPAKRDIIKELADACHLHGIELGFYYSLPDWHYEKGLIRNKRDTTTDCTQFVNQLYSPLEHITPELEEYIVAQLKELLTDYGTINTIWFDMGLLTTAQSRRFRETVKSLQPSCLVSGRVMNNCGDYLTLPDNGNVSGFTQMAWDNPASMYGTWGYRSWCERPELTSQIEKQLTRLISTVSHGGVFLLNIGPKGDGSVLEYEADVIKGIGRWLERYGEAIYGSSASPFTKTPQGVYVTRKGNKLYVINRTDNPEIELYGLTNKITKAYSLDDNSSVKFTAEDNVLRLAASPVTVVEFEGEVKVIDRAVAPVGDRYVLTEDNGIIHSAFDAYGYITTQPRSFMTWTLADVQPGEYNVIIEYTPRESANEYRFSFGNQHIDHILPGVDAMLQTCVIGTVKLSAMDNEVKLDLVTKKNPLESLGLKVKRITISRLTLR